MSADPLEYLRDRDPVAHGSTAPPMEWVLARIESAGGRPGRRRRPRVALVPAVAVAATLGVVALVIVLAVTHRGAAPAHVAPATAPAMRPVPNPDSLMPRGGMRGSVLLQGAAFASPDRLLVYFDSGPGPTTHEWGAATSDGGSSWRVTRESISLTTFAFTGSSGWAEGIDSTRAARFFSTHDGGLTWHVATSDAPAPGGVGNVSTAEGEVWSVGAGCCNDTVLRARASGDHLAATAGQPPLGDSTNVSVAAAGSESAYVLTDDYGVVGKVAMIVRTRLFATHDGGRTWRRMPVVCPGRSFGRLYAGGTDSLWAV